MHKAAQIQLTVKQEAFRKKMLNAWLFRFFLLFKIPMGWLSGMKVIALESDHATSTAPYRWLSRNPFKSMYFAAMAMVAELSTGALALMAIEGQSPSVAAIVVGTEAEFTKRVNSRVYFTCNDGDKLFEAIEKCKESGEGERVRMRTEGKTKDGTVVAVFHFTWSFKLRRV